MPLPESSISVLCNSISQFVRNSINAAANNIAVSIGAPAEVADNDDEQRINLFFYRFEPSGFQSNTHPNDPWRLRVFCLITVFGIQEDGVSAGENELRMLGEVIRVFHEQPVMDTVIVSDEEVRLQTIFSPATDEQINQVWSTQGDATYRPSVIYEMALAPVRPSNVRIEPPIVGAPGIEARIAANDRYSGFSGIISTPMVPTINIDVANPLWQPAICWIFQNNCHYTLSFDVDDPAFESFVPLLWLAGDSTENVNLIWEVWNSLGWNTFDELLSVMPFASEITPNAIPETVPETFPVELALPVSISNDESAVQALLYAERSVSLAPGSDPIIVRSNPLLISLYRVVL